MQDKLTEAMLADGWLPHDGGPCPIDRLVPVQIIIRSGIVTRFKTACSVVWKYGSPIWEDYGKPLPYEAEVIAYKPEPKP